MRRNGTAALALPTTVLVASIWIAIACAGGGTASPPLTVPPLSPGISTAPHTAAPATAAPGTAVVATPAAPTSTPDAQSTATTDELPPLGLLSDGSAPVGGQLGPYCWQGACADGATFEIGSLPVFDVAAASTFSLQDEQAFGSVEIAYVDASGASVPLASAGASFDPDAQATAGHIRGLAFPAPPSGQWVVTAHVRFLQAGDAVYGWQVKVP